MVATEATWPAKPKRCNFLALATLDIEGEEEEEEDGQRRKQRYSENK